jgi:23S rRNA (cytidine1920-2'-O)/16S rRNA (cytidine1409-2'-O)-methyltransferase
MAQQKERLDKQLLALGLAQTRSQAQGLIMSGNVLVDGQRIDKAGALVRLDQDIQLKEKIPFVSRGGLKLSYALKHFEIDVHNKHCLDVGASTGGFTDCLLQNGAHHVVAVDVGSNQLAWPLRQNPRVTSLEQTHINQLPPLTPQPDFACIDVSFISLLKIIQAVMAQGPETIVALIKPQFEYLDYYPNAKHFTGVVSDEAERSLIVEAICLALETTYPLYTQCGLCESPITGPKGNHEFLLYLKKGRSEAFASLSERRSLAL